MPHPHSLTGRTAVWLAGSLLLLVPAARAGCAATSGLPDRVRLRVAYEGARRRDIRFSALYIKYDAK
jgi:hypothetical protein